MTTEERIEHQMTQAQQCQAQIDSIDKQMALLQQRRNTLVLTIAKTEGAIEALREVLGVSPPPAETAGSTG